jgi:hypothetical protein
MPAQLAEKIAIAPLFFKKKIDLFIPADLLGDLDETQLSYIFEDIKWQNANIAVS